MNKGWKNLASRPRKKSVRKLKTVENDETCLHMHCAAWLRAVHPKLLAFHVANERRGGVGTGIHFQRMGVLPGVADWLIFHGGRAVAIELKDATGKQSPDQKNFEHAWRGQQNQYFVVRTLEQFRGIVDALTLF